MGCDGMLLPQPSSWRTGASLIMSPLPKMVTLKVTVEDEVKRSEEYQAILAELRALNEKVDRVIALQTKQESMMTKFQDDLDATLADVQEEKNQIASLSTLIAGLRQQVIDALASAGNIPQAVQDQVAQIFATAEENKAAIATALNSGTAVTGDPAANAPTP